MSKLRELLSRATKGQIEVYTSNSYRRIGIKDDYREIIYPVRSASDGHPDLSGPNLEADLAKIEYLWNNAEALATLIEAAEQHSCNYKIGHPLITKPCGICKALFTLKD